MCGNLSLTLNWPQYDNNGFCNPCILGRLSFASNYHPKNSVTPAHALPIPSPIYIPHLLGDTSVLAAQKKEGEKERSQYYVITAVPHFEEWPRDQIKWMMMMMWWDPGIGADWKGSFQNSFARSNLVNFDFYRSTVYYTPCLFLAIQWQAADDDYRY